MTDAAMKLTRHKTRWVFERYNIVSDADLREAARRAWGDVYACGYVTTLERSASGSSRNF